LEIALTAILVQQCDWSAAWKGVCRLRETGLLDLPKLSAADYELVQRCIREVAFAPTKSRRLVHFAQALIDRGQEKIETYLTPATETSALRKDLLSLDGIGEETADCILLYASEHATFVIDAYTRRAFRRLNLWPELGEDFWSGSYGRLQDFFQRHLRADLSWYAAFPFAEGVPLEVALFRDFHAQLVELGKHHCLKSKPRCHAPGQQGWPGYPICEPHCPEGACSACPMADLCAAAGRSPVLLSPFIEK
jgi:endonuclease-3 related protein